ncbi:MAG: hypothetical protein FJ319_02650 [SAR202 cluster bacterium]|nr:hypothetical protein [SAR202 cluster bacterium]
MQTLRHTYLNRAIRALAAAAALVLAAFAVGRPAAANGGPVIAQDRVGAYAVTVSVNPPDPRPGVVRVTILVEAYVSENGPETARLVAVPTTMRLTAVSPSRSSPDIGPMVVTSLAADASHYNVSLTLPRHGDWRIRAAFEGPLGPGTVEALLPIVREDRDVFPWVIGAAAIAALVLTTASLVVLRRRRKWGNTGAAKQTAR